MYRRLFLDLFVTTFAISFYAISISFNLGTMTAFDGRKVNGDLKKVEGLTAVSCKFCVMRYLYCGRRYFVFIGSILLRYI